MRKRIFKEGKCDILTDNSLCNESLENNESFTDPVVTSSHKNGIENEIKPENIHRSR